MSRAVALWVLAAFFVVAGANHFLNPVPYLAMMPPYLPWPEGLIIVSGVAEIAGGAGHPHPQNALARGLGSDRPAGGSVPGERAGGAAWLAWRTDTAMDVMGASSSSRCVDCLGVLGLSGEVLPKR